MDCIFCKIINDEIPAHKVWEDDKHLAFLDANPLNPGHTLVIPKKHEEYVFDLSDEDYSELFLKAKRLAVPLKKATGAKKIGLVVEGFGVPHAHVHLIPIFEAGELDPSRAKRADSNELKIMAGIIKRFIE